MIRYLLSLPPNLVGCFHELTGFGSDGWFCTSDPVGSHLGSGGGTVWVMENSPFPTCPLGEKSVSSPLKGSERELTVIIHAGGCSRRIPAYAPSGKVLTPIPVVGAEGVSVCSLLDLQKGLYERIMAMAPAGLGTLIASGDVLVSADELPAFGRADVVCFGMEAEAGLMQNHGVFALSRESGDALDFMLQKPSVAKLAELAETHHFLMDIGIWLLSDKAVDRLVALATDEAGNIRDYDLYGAFGLGLGANPSMPEPALKDLSVNIVELKDGRFLHFGTTRELLSSTARINGTEKRVFSLNADDTLRFPEDEGADDIWIENSCLTAGWTLRGRNVVTGVPANSWHVELDEGQCVDMVPVGEMDFALRPYGFADIFRGALTDAQTVFMGMPVGEWMARRGVDVDDFAHTDDIQDAELFPVCCDMDALGSLLTWFLAGKPDKALTELWRNSLRVSANEIAAIANMPRLFAQRKTFVPNSLPQDDEVLVKDMNSSMACSEQLRLQGKDGKECYDRAFAMLRKGLLGKMLAGKSLPRMDVHPDQIVCARCPVRADVAGGWTDTPPYSVMNGGSVVNFAFNINGQPPLHVYVKPNKDYNIVCRSIDLGMGEVVSTYEELQEFNKVGSPFSIPKAALALAGFLPGFCEENYGSLRRQLEAFGYGIDIVTLAAVPAGSGLGTSSILAAAVLGALSDFCALGWSEADVCNRTLVLEQLLTTGGGWQDQYGGVYGGVKLLCSTPGFNQTVDSESLPDSLFRNDAGDCHLMYYTGITRTAKHILVDIVKGMFLGEPERLAILKEMGHHAQRMAQAVRLGDFEAYGRLVRHSWELNRRLDSGTAPAKVMELCRRIDDLCLGYKLLGAGGGGYMYMVAKDAEAARRLQSMLGENPLCPTARFVGMNLSGGGLQISRS